MSEKIAEVGASFDWISPALAAIQDIINGPSHTFLIPYDSGWSGREIAGLLREYGIRSWGHMIVDRTLMLTVRLGQARFAQYLLDRAGIPLVGGQIATSSAGTAGVRSIPRPKAQRATPGRSRKPPKGQRTSTGLDSLLRDVWNMRL